jgi:hypothetical protein
MFICAIEVLNIIIIINRLEQITIFTYSQT